MRSIPPELAQEALDAAPDALIILDEQGGILFANRQTSALFGFSREEIRRQRFAQLVPGRVAAGGRGPGSSGDAADGWVLGSGIETFAQRRDGSEFPVEIRLSVLEASECRLTAAAIRDISDHKRAETELIVARVLAEQAQAAADAARSSADRANLAKGRFLATASHDLRQPLQALALLNRTLRTLVREPAALGALAQQEQTIRAMSRLMNALLDISKLESGAIKPEPTDFALEALFAELHAEFAAIAAEKGLGLRFEEVRAVAHSDPSLVEEILRNLISNAIKYTERGGITVRAVQERGVLRLDVSDTGVGIAPEQLGLIFEEFFQVGVSPNAAREGYGLGLSIVQRIAKLLGAAVTVRSAPGEGSTFSLTVPFGASRAPTRAAVNAAPAPVHRRLRRARVLLVEDDVAVRSATQLLLSVEGYEVTAVAGLADAVRAAREDSGLCLLITDYHLGAGETGLQVIEAVRAILGPQLGAVLVTGDTSSVIRHLRRDECLRIVSKPVDADELLGMLQALLVTGSDADAVA